MLQQQVLPSIVGCICLAPNHSLCQSLPLPQISAQVFQQQRRASALAAQIESVQELLADAQQGVKNAQATVRAAQQLRSQPLQMQAQTVSFHTFLSGLQYDRLSGAQGGWYAGKLLHLLLRRRDAKLGEPAVDGAKRQLLGGVSHLGLPAAALRRQAGRACGLACFCRVWPGSVVLDWRCASP